MKQIAILVAVSFAVIFAASAHATPLMITAASADTVTTTFMPTGGLFNKGVIDFTRLTPVEFDYSNNTKAVIQNALMSLETSLFLDTSVGGLASGEFLGGSFAVLDLGTSTILLDGNIDFFLMNAVIPNSGYMSGTGEFQVTGGSMMPVFGTYGDVFDVSFSIQPKNVSNFQNRFTGLSDFTLIPVSVPEPAILLLGGGAVVLLSAVARKRMRAGKAQGMRK